MLEIQTAFQEASDSVGYENQSLTTGYTAEAVADIIEERKRQNALPAPPAASMDDFDRANSRNDWIAYAVAYLGRASSKVFRNDREKCDHRENLVKAGAIIVAAIEAHDQGFSQPRPPS